MINGQNGYQHLEFYEGRAIPRIRGTAIDVGTLMIQYRAWDYKRLEDLAADRDLPVDAVREAYDWYTKNNDVVTAMCSEERRRLGVKE